MQCLPVVRGAAHAMLVWRTLQVGCHRKPGCAAARCRIWFLMRSRADARSCQTELLSDRATCSPNAVTSSSLAGGCSTVGAALTREGAASRRRLASGFNLFIFICTALYQLQRQVSSAGPTNCLLQARRGCRISPRTSCFASIDHCWSICQSCWPQHTGKQLYTGSGNACKALEKR